MMKLQNKLQNFCCALIVVVLGLFLGLQCFMRTGTVFAEDQTTEANPDGRFVTIYDNGSYRTVKTSADSVREVLEKANIEVNASDIVEPGLDTVLTGGDYNINIYRSRPVVVIDGAKKRYLMTASYDAKVIAKEAGITVYDGDEIKLVPNDNFLEAGVASTFRIERSGGRTVTVEEVLPYTTEVRYDYNLAKGETHLERAGEDGRKVSVYEVQFANNVEVSRKLISEEVKLEAVPEVVVVGAKISVAPNQEICLGWLREAGVPEESLEAAIYIIYHESGCRVDARNASSGAYGIPQALPGSKMASAGSDWETNPITQIRWMNSYVTGRYGGWQAALEFKLSRGWY